MGISRRARAVRPFVVMDVVARAKALESAGRDIVRLEIGGNPHRLVEWLGEPGDRALDNVEIDWAAPHGQPGIQAAHFRTRRGLVRI